MRVARTCLLSVWLLLASGITPALAQSCAMCRANAKATPKEGQRAINRAILVMLVPPLGAMFLGSRFVIGYARRRDRENERDADS